MSVGDARQHHVLIVDDEVVACDLIRRLLEKDHRVSVAHTGRQGLALVADERPDLIITDQRMPEMSGVDFLAEARKVHPDCIRIVLTAYSDPDVMIDAINRGEIYRFVFKPWNPVEMRTEIRRALERLDLQRENARLLLDLRDRNADLERSLAELREARDRLLRAEKLALAGRFAAGFTHDIRNYLVVMTGLEAFSDRYAHDEHLAEVLRFIGDAANDLRAMVGELTSLARGETPRYTKVPSDLAAVVRYAVRMVNYTRIGQSRKIEVECGELPQVAMQADRVRRLVLNIVQNAAEASPEGGLVKVRVAREGGEAVVRISDSGDGVPEELRDRIFEPFFTTKAQGTGLGLDICRTIAAGHGGRIAVEGAPGQGATFVVRLPLS